MATLQLDRVWINLMSTGETVSAYTDPNRPQSHEMDGEVRTYAGGRQRSISQEGERTELGYTLVDLSLSTVDKLRTWKGLHVQVRDHRGQRWFGVFHAVVPDEGAEPTEYAATIVVRAVTTAEGV